MIDRGTDTNRHLWLSGIVAAALAMALALAGIAIAVAALAGFAVGAALYFALLLNTERKP